MKARKALAIVASIVVLSALGVALAIGAGGCGDADETNAAVGIIESSVASTTETATTETEGTMGIGPELISQTKTLADVTGEIPEGKFLVTADEASQYNEGTYVVVDPDAIDPTLQAEFQSTQSGLSAESDLSILWLGDENRGDELNAAVTNRLFMPFGLGEDQGYKRNFVGALPNSIPSEIASYYAPEDLFAEVGLETTLPGLASGVFMSLIPVADPEEPDTLDHYMEVYVPFLDQTFYARICLDDWGSIFGAYISTRMDCLNLHSPQQNERPYEWIVGSYWLRSLLFTQDIDLSAIMQPGDWVMLSFSLQDDLTAPFVDSRGVQYINRINVQRFQEDAFKSTWLSVYPGADWELVPH